MIRITQKLSVLSAALTVIAVMAEALPITAPEALPITAPDNGDIIDPTALHILNRGASDPDPVILGHAISSCPEIIIRPALAGQLKVLVLVAQSLNHPQCRYFQSVY